MDRVLSFLLWPKREGRGPWKQARKKRGSITCRTDRANKANKMFIIWLCWLFRFLKGDRELEVRTATYGPGIDQSQHAKSVSHIIMNDTQIPYKGMFDWLYSGIGINRIKTLFILIDHNSCQVRWKTRLSYISHPSHYFQLDIWLFCESGEIFEILFLFRKRRNRVNRMHPKCWW